MHTCKDCAWSHTNETYEHCEQARLFADYCSRFVLYDGIKNIKCECGGDKTKTTHSTWCPKYKEKGGE